MRSSCPAQRRVSPYLAIFMFAACGVVAVAADGPVRSKADLAAQLAQLQALWPGVYDNNEQIVRQSGGGLSKPTAAPFFRVRTAFTLTQRPDLGPVVLELREYRNNNLATLTRHQFYALAIDAAAGGIRVRRVEAATLGSPAALCDLILRWEGSAFRGGTAPELCSAARGQIFDEQLLIGARHYWQRSRTLDARSGRVVQELNPGSLFGWNEQTRAREFRCTVNHNAAGDMTQTAKLMTIDLDDQGREADMPWPDGRILNFVIHRRAFTSPADREFVLFRVHEKGRHVPIAYAYAEDTAERFGLNLGWFYILCAPRDAVPPGG